ncbi:MULTISPECIES: PaaI family thioesterase [unclassified Corynebacterium]|uniref:PaaI family thioesterase n=2 Tax=unclassified Corynebacterium TaxID=2624378 RepID=UPI001FEEE7C7|nr:MULTISPECIES: PaaI family thioesterase [unclassified Corynebacterium]
MMSISKKTVDILELLSTIPSEGLSQEDLSIVQQYSGGFTNHLGLLFTHANSEKVCAQLPVKENHLQVTGVVNGGVYCAIAETVGSVMGLIASKGVVVLGVNNSTDFLSSVADGVIEAQARVIKAGRKTQLISIEMFNQEKLVARSTLRTLLVPQ